MKTTFNDVNKPECERREYRGINYRSAMGKSTVDIICPFCNSQTVAYIWSLSGGGKRCTCGALFGSRGVAYKLHGQQL